MTEDVGTIGGMGLEIALDGITVVGITGDHKESEHEIGIGGRTGLHGRMDIGGWSGIAFIKPVLELGGIGITSGGIGEEIGTEEHQGGETLLVIGIVNGDIGIAIHTCDTGGVTMGFHLGDLMTVFIVEDIDHLLLEVLEEVATEEALLAGIIEDDIALLDIGEIDTPLVVGNIDANSHVELALLDSHLGDGAFLAHPGSHLHTDGIAHGHLVDGMTEEELELTTLDGLTQQLHLRGGDLDGLALVVAIVIHTQTRRAVPLSIDDATDALFGGMDKHKVMELLTDVLVIGHSLHHKIGYEVVHWLGGSGSTQRAFVLLLQHDVDQLGLEVDHYIPI